MRHYLIRVFLPYGETKHYRHLLKSLSPLGIQDVLQQPGGLVFKLPPGEYYLQSELATDEVRERVYEIASQLSKASVVVMSGEKIAWVGLETC